MKTSLHLLAISCLFPFFAFAQYSGGAPYTAERGGLIINEISQGPAGGLSEYIEFVVTANPNDPLNPVDISGWITDDNNVPSGGQGNAPGHISFGDCYTAVPPGSILVVYNNESPNPLIPGPDPMDGNGDGVYFIPHDAACMDACPSNPTSSNGQFCPCANPTNNPTGWEHGLRNGGDVVQVRDACETVIHVIHWGNVSLTADISSSPVQFDIGGSQSGRVILFRNLVNDNWNNPANYANPSVIGNESPGAANNTANADFIASLADGSFNYSGIISDCRDTDAGDLEEPQDAPSVSPITLCQGEDLGAFVVNYDQMDEMEPDAVGFTYEYAYLLVLPNGNIIAYSLDGDFDFSGLSMGTYFIFGLSYIQTNGSVSIEDFLNSFINNIQDIEDYAACGYHADLTNLNASNTVVEVNISASLDAVEPNQPLEACSPFVFGTATFDLTQLEQTITDGQGGQVNWYSDQFGNTAIGSPENYTTMGTTVVYASVGSGNCESELVPVVLIAYPAFLVEATEVQAIDCNGAATAIIQTEISAGPPTSPLTYDWDDDAFDGLSELNGVPAGMYSVTVTDANGCQSSASITVSDPEQLSLNCQQLSPVSTFGGNDGIGEFDPEGGTLPYTFTWDPFVPGFDMTSFPGPFEVPNLSAGIYNITVTDANGCEATCNFEITEPDCTFTVEFTTEPNLCPGDSIAAITLDISGGVPPIDINWSTGETTPTIDNLPIGTYMVTVTDASGCEQGITFVIGGLPPVEIDLEVSDPTCFNLQDGQITINSISGGEPPYFIYNNGEFLSLNDGSTFIIGNLEPGDYEVVIEDQSGCPQIQEVTIEDIDELSLELGNSQTINLGEQVQLSPILNFEPGFIQWLPPNYLSDSSALRPIATPEETITYQLIAGLNADCIISDTITFEVDKTKRIYIPNAFSPNDDGFNDRFTIYGDISVREVVQFQVFDRWGEQIYNADGFAPNDESFGWNGKFRGEAAGTGIYVYFVEIEFVDGERQIYKGDVLLIR